MPVMTDPGYDTIAALATPAGRGGVGIVRVSGPDARRIGEAMLPALPVARRATLAWIRDAQGRAMDKGLAIFFPGPGSYTGEDVLELHGHGGPVLMEAMLRCAVGHGARLAEPGEFTRRAWLNDKMDLTQAEAVADLIDSATGAAARAAARSLHGEFSARIHELVEALTVVRVHVEAAIDFPEEEIDFLADPVLLQRVADVRELFDSLLRSARQGQLLRDGMTVVIAGRPNAGKSSLLNRLAGHDAAIVTEHAGTTRDVLRHEIQIDGMPLRVLDTAGIRESDDPVEREGVRRAREAIAQADRVLLIVDATQPEESGRGPLPADVPVTIVRNKIDLLGRPASVCDDGSQPVVELSALRGDGIDLLREHLKACMGFAGAGESDLIARRRHLDALQRARAHLEKGHEELTQHAAGEIMAEELRLAQGCLGEITGQVTSDDLLGEIFGRFCIGK